MLKVNRVWLFAILSLGIADGLLGQAAKESEGHAEFDEIVLAKAGNGDSIFHPCSRQMREMNVAGKSEMVPVMMVLVPAGDFQFGAGTEAKTVTLPAYCIGKFSVTNAEYAEFLKANPSIRSPSYWKNGTFPNGKDSHPVVYVSLENARAYAAWISKETGFNVGIPTSEQWEHAARGPHNYLYPWGNSQDVRVQGGKIETRFRYNAVTAIELLAKEPKKIVTYNREKSPYHGKQMTLDQLVAYNNDGRETPFTVSGNGSVRGWVNHDTWTGFIYTDVFHEMNAVGGDTAAVGSYPRGMSEYGCFDMAGNVWNWCDTEIVAKNGAEKGKKVNEIRGGSWYANGNSCKSIAIGEGRSAKGNYNTVGFRIVMSWPLSAPAK